MSESSRHKGPWFHRFLIRLLGVVLALLCFWLIGFVVNDLGNLPGPSYQELEERILDQSLVARHQELRDSIRDTKRTIGEQQRRQDLLRDSTSNSQRTMNQLLAFQKLSLEKDVAPSAQEQQALAESQRLFLSNQKAYQELNERISELTDRLNGLEAQERELQTTLNEARKPIREEHHRLQRRHNLRMAGLKMAVLLPLLVVALVLFLKLRGGPYAILAYAVGAAVLVKVGLVMHEYFPARFFKYILIGVCLLIVLRALFYLIRMLARPQRSWLLKQYREAYEAFVCPICSYPIRRGPMKFLYWDRRSIRRLASRPGGEAEDADEPYVCPACSTTLYEKCSKCGQTRHSLLPTCQSCGDTTEAGTLNE
jgi:predicted RNA-binding Zn-ribbon protein involved in translation (DUF1610 family)